MKYAPALALALLASGIAAVDILVYNDPSACEGSGGYCSDVPDEVCCLTNNPPGGSTLFLGTEPNAEGAPYGPSGCDKPLVSVMPIPFCFVSNTPDSIGGGAWAYPNQIVKRSAPKSCAINVTADPAYTHGASGKTYVISNAKMAAIAPQKPTDETELLNFFKSNAEKVVDGSQTSAPTYHGGPSTTK